MIEFIDIGIENVVAYRLEGKISTDEMTEILDLFRSIIEKGDKINIYQEITSIGGAELSALKEKLKFFMDVGLSNFNRIAVVADKKWIPKLIDVEGKIFKNVDMKGFSMTQKEEALEFLKNA